MTPEEQVARLRDLTRKGNCLHELQATQLRAWPLALFDLEKCRAEVSFDKHEISFRAKFKTKPPKDAQKRFTGLAESVHDLLGEEWTIRLFDGRKCLFTLEAKIAPPQSLNEGVDFEAGRIVPETPWNPRKKD